MAVGSSVEIALSKLQGPIRDVPRRASRGVPHPQVARHQLEAAPRAPHPTAANSYMAQAALCAKTRYHILETPDEPFDRLA